MNRDRLNDLWNSDSNRPDTVAGAYLAEQFLAGLRRRRRWQVAWLTWTFFALTVITVWAAVHALAQGVSSLVSQWSLIPMLALPWIVALRLLAQFRRERTPEPDAALPLREALAAARLSNLAERRRLAFIGLLLAVMTPVVGLAVWQLHGAGKATANQAWSMAAVFGAALALGGLTVALRLGFRLQPEGRRLEALQQDLESTGSPGAKSPAKP